MIRGAETITNTRNELQKCNLEIKGNTFDDCHCLGITLLEDTIAVILTPNTVTFISVEKKIFQQEFYAFTSHLHMKMTILQNGKVDDHLDLT